MWTKSRSFRRTEAHHGAALAETSEGAGLLGICRVHDSCRRNTELPCLGALVRRTGKGIAKGSHMVRPDNVCLSYTHDPATWPDGADLRPQTDSSLAQLRTTRSSCPKVPVPHEAGICACLFQTVLIPYCRSHCLPHVNVPLSRQEAHNAAERSVKTDAFWQQAYRT